MCDVQLEAIVDDDRSLTRDGSVFHTFEFMGIDSQPDAVCPPKFTETAARSVDQSVL